MAEWKDMPDAPGTWLVERWRKFLNSNNPVIAQRTVEEFIDRGGSAGIGMFSSDGKTWHQLSVWAPRETEWFRFYGPVPDSLEVTGK